MGANPLGVTQMNSKLTSNIPIKAESMIPGNWYWTEEDGRFVASEHCDDGFAIVYLDGDQDMQSLLGISFNTLVYPAISKC